MPWFLASRGVLWVSTQEDLTHCSLVMPYIWVSIGSDNDLLPDDTKPLPESMMPFHQKGAVELT